MPSLLHNFFRPLPRAPQSTFRKSTLDSPCNFVMWLFDTETETESNNIFPCHGSTKDWVTLEADLSPLPLKFSPWIPWGSYQTSVKNHPVTGSTLRNFHKLIKTLDISSQSSPLTPMKDNPDFEPCLNNPHFRSLDGLKPLLAGDCFNKGAVKEWVIL